MRAVVQRVTHAHVVVDGEVIGEIGSGLLIYVGVAVGDHDDQARWMAGKIAEMRLFPDEQGRFDRSLMDTAGAVLVVSQFTLLADTSRGRRPSFFNAAPPELAQPLVETVMAELRSSGVVVAGGRFGAHMLVESTNDGPVTITLDSEDREQSRRI